MTVDPFTSPTGAFLSAVGLELQPVDAADVAAQGVRGSLVVDERHHTPWGVVHGACGRRSWSRSQAWAPASPSLSRVSSPSASTI